MKIALAGSLALTVIAIGLTLAHSPMSVSRKNGVFTNEEVVTSTSGASTFCQPNELLPPHTSAIRPWMGVNTGPKVKVAVLSAGRVVTSGERGSGWIGRSVTVPVKPLARAVSDATICISFQLHDETIGVYGEKASRTIGLRDNGRILPGRMWIEYLRPGAHSWASMLSSIALHMQFGRTTTGTWIVLLILALVLAIAALASRLVLKEVR